MCSSRNATMTMNRAVARLTSRIRPRPGGPKPNRPRRPYATLVGPTSILPNQKHPLPPPPSPVPIPDGPAATAPRRPAPRQQQPERKARASELTPLDVFLLSRLRAVTADGTRPGLTPVADLLAQLRERDGHQLQATLTYEASPPEARRLALKGQQRPTWALPAEDLILRSTSPTSSSTPAAFRDDGVVLVAHVLPATSASAPPTVVTCHGVALETSPPSKLVATCAHPLSHLSPLPPPGHGGSLVVTGSGAVYVIEGVASALTDSDLVVLQVADRPAAASADDPAWATAPISPYPIPVHTPVHVHRPDEQRWDVAEVTEYKDAMGIAAKPGTYDHLENMSFSAPPEPGASGGPVVSPAGAVVGLIRGRRADYGDRRERGFAIVAERLWEVFRLPGFKPASEKRREAAEAAAQRERDDVAKTRRQ